MTPNQFSHRQQIRKPAVVSRGGIVAAQSRKAAEIGAEVLADFLTKKFAKAKKR